MMHKYEIRTRTFLDLRKHLAQKGTNIEQAISRIKNSALENLQQKRVFDEKGMGSKLESLKQYKGKFEEISKATAGNESGQGLDLNDLIAICSAQKFEVDAKNVLAPIMDTFEKDVFGEVPCSEFIAQFKGILVDLEETLKADEQGKPLVEAARYFSSIEDIFKEIGDEIVVRKLKDFGSFLKGNDFNNDGLIPRASFYQILKELFNQLLGEGDILDVIRFFDPKETDFIDIDHVAYQFN